MHRYRANVARVVREEDVAAAQEKAELQPRHEGHLARLRRDHRRTIDALQDAHAESKTAAKDEGNCACSHTKSACACRAYIWSWVWGFGGCKNLRRASLFASIFSRLFALPEQKLRERLLALRKSVIVQTAQNEAIIVKTFRLHADFLERSVWISQMVLAFGCDTWLVDDNPCPAPLLCVRTGGEN